MKNTFYHLLIIVICAYIAQGCTTNDGDIGNRYGNWKLKEITLYDSIAHPNDLCLSFQSEVVFARITEIENHYAWELPGSCICSTDSLFMTFVVRDNDGSTLREFMGNRFCFPIHNDLNDKVLVEIHLGIDFWHKKKAQFSKDDSVWIFEKF